MELQKEEQAKPKSKQKEGNSEDQCRNKQNKKS